MVTAARQIHTISTDELRNVSVDMSAMLADDEVITGAPSVQCSADLVITNEQYNSAAIEINGETVAIGKAVQFTVESSVAGKYRIEVLANTSEGQVVEGAITLSVSNSTY
jgi:hypothetical protein